MTNWCTSWLPDLQRLQGGPCSAPTQRILSFLHTVQARLPRVVLAFLTSPGGGDASVSSSSSSSNSCLGTRELELSGAGAPFQEADPLPDAAPGLCWYVCMGCAWGERE